MLHHVLTKHDATNNLSAHTVRGNAVQCDTITTNHNILNISLFMATNASTPLTEWTQTYLLYAQFHALFIEKLLKMCVSNSMYLRYIHLNYHSKAFCLLQIKWSCITIMYFLFFYLRCQKEKVLAVNLGSEILFFGLKQKKKKN